MVVQKLSNCRRVLNGAQSVGAVLQLNHWMRSQTELQGTNILVNAYSPGWMQTDMGGSNAPFTADGGAETAVYLAMLPDSVAQGKFFAEMRKFGGAIALPW